MFVKLAAMMFAVVISTIPMVQVDIPNQQPTFDYSGTWTPSNDGSGVVHMKFTAPVTGQCELGITSNQLVPFRALASSRGTVTKDETVNLTINVPSIVLEQHSTVIIEIACTEDGSAILISKAYKLPTAKSI